MNSGWVAYDNISLTQVAGSQVSYLAYDAENRLKSVSGEVNASYAYDGDGRRVKMVVGGVTTVFAGETFEWTGSTAAMKKYYYAGQRRVAMRVGSTLERITFNTASWKG